MFSLIFVHTNTFPYNTTYIFLETQADTKLIILSFSSLDPSHTGARSRRLVLDEIEVKARDHHQIPQLAGARAAPEKPRQLFSNSSLAR